MWIKHLKERDNNIFYFEINVSINSPTILFKFCIQENTEKESFFKKQNKLKQTQKF